jgi:hypothetical protein
VIKPTVGRIVIYHRPGANPAAAFITYVHSGDRLINVGGFDSAGVPFGATSVRLQQPEESGVHPLYAYATWPERAAANAVG